MTRRRREHSHNRRCIHAVEEAFRRHGSAIGEPGSRMPSRGADFHSRGRMDGPDHTLPEVNAIFPGNPSADEADQA